MNIGFPFFRRLSKAPDAPRDTTPTEADRFVFDETVGRFVYTKDGGGGGGAPTNAQYVALATNGTLTNERVLTAGTGISITDNGAGSTVVIAATGGSGLTQPQILARGLGA